MVVPLTRSNDPVVAGGVGISVAAQLQRFKIPLYVISGGYTVAVLMALIASEPGQSLAWFFMLIMANSIAMNQGQQMVSQCVVPFSMFATMTMFLDMFSLISVLNEPYPGAEDFFSTSCPYNDSYTTKRNNTMYTESGTEFLIPAGTDVFVEVDKCTANGRIIFHAVMLAVILLDLAATFVGWRMLSVLLSQVPLEDVEAAATSPSNPFMGPSPPRVGLPGEGSGRPFEGAGQQEMIGVRPAQHSRQNRRNTAASRGFQPFQGDSARLSM